MCTGDGSPKACLLEALPNCSQSQRGSQGQETQQSDEG